MAGASVRKTQLDSIVMDGQQQRPTRDLIGKTALLAAVFDLRAQVDIAAGGGADGTRNVEAELRLANRIRIFDGSTPILDLEPRQLRQLANRGGEQVPSGVVLANTGIQAATLIRQQIIVWFSPKWLRNPAEMFLALQHPDQAYIEVEWPGVTNADFAGAINTGGTRTITITNIACDVALIHDPVMFLQVAPLYVPRFKSKQQAATQNTDSYEFEWKGTGRLVESLLHTVDNNVSTENIINRIGWEDQQDVIDRRILARSQHEYEQFAYGGVEDGEVGMAYFYKRFSHNGLLSKSWRAGQGAKPKHLLDVTGGANRQVRMVTTEAEQVGGLTLDKGRPDWAL